MGFPCVGIEMPKLIKHLLNLLAHVRIMVMMVFFHIGVLDPPNQEHSILAEDEPSPSSSMVVKKMDVVAVEFVKKSLPVVEFGNFVDRTRSCPDDKLVCAVCLCCLERNHEIRELSNCTHVFHRGCLDKWVDQGQVTCPLCRSNLLAIQEEETRGGGDSWMVERIAYLLGEDLLID
ncbi:PREDICTED: E3 ubiquitin-protein ligase RHA1B-like [Nelumbo nucifera]|uniref:E3 ubiquitin-protein ligase RHA1B-like n=2 Tax=Nelumbo nucifera TaxID=4432 RepID=A0A1U7YQ34_NELNU|nr:PREDICTED: E3 ubiquitin-protein ligase RHA1B-like [Nelumbo nucifera]DAD37763.1 TPA_asm: hypothetical protein HUJ06_008404 [Nelumbo nucifera]